jgi:hypothetical protein
MADDGSRRNQYLVTILLPLRDNDNKPFDAAIYRLTRDELVDQFGGLTTYTRSPAKGIWEKHPGNAVSDELIVYEIICEALNEPWWRGYRSQLEKRFLQDSLLIRANPIVVL